jgi:hypothetical protein
MVNQLICNEFALQQVLKITKRHPLGLTPSIVACEVYQKAPRLHGGEISFPTRGTPKRRNCVKWRPSGVFAHQKGRYAASLRFSPARHLPQFNEECAQTVSMWMRLKPVLVRK